MTIPIEIIATNLQRERKSAALSLGEVARRAGIAKSTLSQLESGQGNPSLETLWALCVALNIPFAKLVEVQTQSSQVIRYGEGASVTSEISNYQAVLLATCPPNARRDVYILTTQLGEPRCSQPHPVGSVEHIIIMQGSAKVGLVNAYEVLKAGDYMSYPADQAHIFEALEQDTRAILISEQR